MNDSITFKYTWGWDGGMPIYVDITLEDGEWIEISRGGPTDEGWQAKTEHIQYHADVQELRLKVDSAGADCDGRLDRHIELVAGSLHFNGTPDWQEESSSQRDYQAEAAGY